jgi:hypothetical protein
LTAVRPPPGTLAAAVAGNLTAHFESTGQLPVLVERVSAERCVAVTGPAGTGKSVLAAALGRPELAPGVVPKGLVQAMVFLDRGSTDISVARELRDQLRVTVPSFTAAEAAYRSTGEPTWPRLRPHQPPRLRPQPPRHPHHPRRHRLLDRAGRGRGRGVAAVSGAAA